MFTIVIPMTNLFPTPGILLLFSTDTYSSLIYQLETLGFNKRGIAYAMYSIVNELDCKINLVYLFVYLLLIHV